MADSLFPTDDGVPAAETPVQGFWHADEDVRERWVAWALGVASDISHATPDQMERAGKVLVMCGGATWSMDGEALLLVAGGYV